MKREMFFVRAKRLKAEIEQIFTDCAHWNQHMRAPGEDFVDPDPDGSLRSALAYCDGILSGDVYVAPERSKP